MTSNLTHEDFAKYYDAALLYVNLNCNCGSYRESENKVLAVMQAMKESEGQDLFNQAIALAKVELNARNLTKRVALRAIEIHRQLKKEAN